MKTTRQIKEGIELVINKRLYSTSVKLYVDGTQIALCKVEGTNSSFWIGYDFNEHYLVIYSRGCMANQIPLTVEAVYDMANKKIIPVLNKNKVIFEYMCIAKKGIYTSVILEFLNDNKIQIAEEEEVEDFIRYITAGNEEIAEDEIKLYILKEYPFLSRYMNFENTLSVKEYRKLMDEIEHDILRFHIMPKQLKEEYLS